MSGEHNNLSCCRTKDEKIYELSQTLKAKEEEIKFLKMALHGKTETCSLSSVEITRYSRQIILPSIGINGQSKLKNTSVLIVGAGGLGCPVGIYLAAAGIETIGIVDHDEVDITNLHRQILHTEKTVGESKCVSFVTAVKALNSSTNCIIHNVLLNSVNISPIIKYYDIIVDASDNLPTRYLLNDAAVLFKKPLVSGSALRFDGQLIVYNYKDGPCLRCLFPIPAKPDITANCSDAGVVGPVTGVIGSLQALEVMKIALGTEPSFSKQMYVFDGLNGKLHTIKLRPKSPNCDICSSTPKITHLVDYEAFCQMSATDKVQNITILHDKDRISCKAYEKILQSETPHLLIDVRPNYELDIFKFPHSLNFPFQELENGRKLNDLLQIITESKETFVLVICHRGNDSQRAVKIIQEHLTPESVQCCDIEGGLQAWHDEVNPNCPIY